MSSSELGWPSLAHTIAAVRRDLAEAMLEGQDKSIQFRTGPVELELEVGVTNTGGGEAGVRLYVVTLSGKGEREKTTTQRVKLTLQPIDIATGSDLTVSDWVVPAGPEGPS